MQTYDSNLGLSYFRASARVIMIYLLPRPDYYYFLDYTLPFINKGLYSQSYGLSSSHARMWELDRKEGWMPKNWCFWIMVLEKILRVPWTARGSNQSILKEINPEYLLEELMLKLQYLGQLM